MGQNRPPAAFCGTGIGIDSDAEWAEVQLIASSANGRGGYGQSAEDERGRNRSMLPAPILLNVKGWPSLAIKNQLYQSRPNVDELQMTRI